MVRYRGRENHRMRWFTRMTPPGFELGFRRKRVIKVVVSELPESRISIHLRYKFAWITAKQDARRGDPENIEPVPYRIQHTSFRESLFPALW